MSPTTASRVIAGRTNVSAATRSRVLAAADDLGYVVNGLAQAMMGHGRRSVALVTSYVIGPTFAKIAAGAEEVATSQRNLFMVSTTGGQDQRERDLMETLREQRTAGVLLVGSTVIATEFEKRVADYARNLAGIGARLVLCGHPELPSVPGVMSVDYDQVDAIAAVVGRLAAQGHERIAFIGMQKAMSTPEQRFGGYRAGLAEAGLHLDPALVVECPNDGDAAAASARELLGRADRPTAVVCLTDVVAVGVYHAARELGLGIPGDVAVVGFDDAPFVGELTPGLTTIRAPFRELGVRAARFALGLDDYTGHVVLPTELVIRGSALTPMGKAGRTA